MIPRGYVAAVLAFVPAQEGVEVPLLSDIIVMLIIVTTLISIVGVALYSRLMSPADAPAPKKGGRKK